MSDRPRIILVSKEYRPEVTATVLWLRNFGVDITCVKITPYQIDKDRIAFESNILIPLPEAKNFIIQAEKKEDVEHNLTLSQGEYIKFYQDLLSRLKPIIPLQYSEPSPRSYYQIPTGISSFHFEWGFHGRPRSSFGVELHLEKGNKDFNTKVINSLKAFKAEIEQKTGEKVIYQNDWGRVWARLYIEKNEGSMTEELKQWAVEKMEILFKILQPELDKLK